jgi:hypothetical protein
MDIRNVTQFASFVSNSDLATLNPTFRQIVICMGDFLRYCDCHSREDKDRIYKNCNQLYLDAARMAASKHKGEFLNKTGERQIAFYTETGQLIAIASR